MREQKKWNNGMVGKDLRTPLIISNLSLPRRRESGIVRSFWIPAFAGMTFLGVALNGLIENGLGIEFHEMGE